MDVISSGFSTTTPSSKTALCVPPDAMNLSYGEIASEVVGNPMLKVAVTEVSEETVHESDTLPRKIASQGSAGKLETVKVN